MKNALLKDTFREIWRTLSRFLSIFSIVALGVAFFAGVKAAAIDMRLTGDKYFDDYHLMDVRIVSTMGLDDKDVAAISREEGIESLRPSYSMDAIAAIGDREMVVKLHSMPDAKAEDTSINRTILVKGRYPEKANECVVEGAKMFDSNSALGTRISLASGTDKDISESLENKEYTVVGVVETPYYISYDRGTSSVGNGKVNSFVMIPEQNFKLPVFTEVFVTIKGAREIFTFDEEYESLVDSFKDRLEKVAEVREQLRYDEIMAEAEDKLGEGRAELAKAEAEAAEELGKAADKLISGRSKLAEGEKELRNQVNQFDSAIKEGEKKIAEGYRQLEAGEKDYAAQLEAYNQSKPQLPSEVIASMEVQLQAGRKTLDATRQQLGIESQRLTSSKAKAEAEFAAAEKKLAVSKAQLAEGESEFLKAKQEADEKLAEGRAELLEAETEVNKLEKPNWYILDRNANPGYVDYDYSAERVAAIAQVFPVFFFLIAALVCLTTMTRMVDEQRTYIGTLKALGYSKLAIASKYLMYAILASLGGSIVGVLIGFKLFPTVIFNAYSIMFNLPHIITAFNTYYAVLSTALAVAITSLAAWFACNQELKAEPSILMRPKAPKAGKRILLERVRFIWSRLNFTQKITARNLFRYKKRFLMTALGIGGCTALLLSGFGLRDSIVSIAAIQFDELYKYDMVMQLKNEVALGSKNTLIERISKENRISDYMLTKEQSMDVEANGKKKSVSMVVPESTSRLSEFIEFRIRGSKEKVSFAEDGVILTEKLARQLQLSAGDEINIYTDGEKKTAVRVAGITEHYISHYIYMPPSLYKKVFNKELEFKQVMAKLRDTSEEFEDQLSKELLKNEEAGSIRFTTGISQDFKKIIKSLNYIVLVLIFSAGALAFIVLYNLTNVNVTERLREIATIKVLGFFDREVSAYVDRESMLLTIIGMLLGLVLGIFFHRYIIVTAEVEYVMFGRIIGFMSYIYAALLTMAFAVLVNIVIHFKLKRISMVESLKSVD